MKSTVSRVVKTKKCAPGNWLFLLAVSNHHLLRSKPGPDFLDHATFSYKYDLKNQCIAAAVGKWLLVSHSELCLGRKRFILRCIGNYILSSALKTYTFLFITANPYVRQQVDNSFLSDSCLSCAQRSLVTLLLLCLHHCSFCLVFLLLDYWRCCLCKSQTPMYWNSSDH